ncbi:hypothetical protein QZH46_10765 [Pseudomonas corrugata]
MKASAGYAENNNGVLSSGLMASLAANQFDKMRNSGQLPDNLTSDDLRYLSRQAQANEGVLESGLYESVFGKRAGIKPWFSAAVNDDTDLLGSDSAIKDSGSVALDLANAAGASIYNVGAKGVNTVWAALNIVPITWSAVSDRSFEQASSDLMMLGAQFGPMGAISGGVGVQ